MLNYFYKKMSSKILVQIRSTYVIEQADWQLLSQVNLWAIGKRIRDMETCRGLNYLSLLLNCAKLDLASMIISPRICLIKNL